QVAGRNVGGEFAAHERAQATFTPPANDTVDSREAVEARLTEAFTTAAINREDLPDETWEQVNAYLQKHVPDYEKELIYVDRDDQLTPENINDYLSGEQDRYIDMENDILDSYSEGRYLRSEEMARELIEQFVNNDDDLV